MYDTGYGVPQDDAQAVSWFRQAAEQGNVNAQSNLGLMYFVGRGVPKNLVRALKWRNLAVSHASAERQGGLAGTRDSTARLMTPAQLASAETLVREWQAAFDARQE
jgi:TPR repeat protein